MAEEDDRAIRLQLLMDELSTPEGQLLRRLRPAPDASGLEYTEEGYPFFGPNTPPPTQTAAPAPAEPMEALKALAPTPPEQLQGLIPVQQPPTPEPPVAALEPEPTVPLPPVTVTPEEPPKPEPLAEAGAPLISYLGAPGREIAKMTEPVRQVVAGGLGTIAGFPWDLATGLQAFSVIGKQNRFGPDSSEAKEAELNLDWLQSQGIGARAGIKYLVGAAPEAETPVEKGSALFGESFTPAKGYTIPLTGAMAGLRALINARKPEVQPISKELQALLETPPQGEPQMPEPMPKESENAFAKRMDKYETDWNAWNEGQSIVKRPQPPRKRAKETDEQFAERMKAFSERQTAWQMQLTPTAKTTIATVGGERQLKNSDLWGMGIMAGVSIGMIAAPPIYRLFRDTILPKPMTPREVATRPVPIPGVEGVEAITRPVDVMRAVGDDVNLATVRLAERAMMHPEKVQRLEDLLRTQTRGQQQALIDGAIRLGEMQGNTLEFKAPVSLVDLSKAIKSVPDAKAYLIVRDVAEELNVRSQMQKHKPNATVQELEAALGHALPEAEVEAFGRAGPPVVQGMTMDQALTAQAAYERADPRLREIGDKWTKWNKAVYEFEGEGEAATRPIDRKLSQNPGVYDRSVEYLMEQRPNSVPWSGQRSIGMSFEDRVNHTDPIDALNKRSRIAMKGRMENEARLLIVDEFRELNPNYFKRIEDEYSSANGRIRTAREIMAEHPEWAPYTVKVFRRGEPEYYLTDQTFADLIKFDMPSITGSGQWLFAAKRLFESNYTGMLNPAFSVTNALRVWHGAKHMNLEGLAPPTILGMAKSIPQSLYPQVANYFTKALEEGSGNRLSQYLPPQSRQGLSRRLAAMADDALFTAIQRGGGAHGSTLEQALRAQKIEEATAKFQKAGGVALRFWNMYKPLIQAVHEAPMNAFVDKNFGRLPLPELLAKARDLGGDPKITGQYYFVDPVTKKTHPIRYETDSKLEKALVAGARAYGLGMEFGRTSIPWTNAIAQSLKRVGVAYLDDPAKFVAKTWLYTMFPAGVQYMWNHSIGTDPNGVRYADHQMNGRNTYTTLTSWYMGIPGRPVEDGVELSAVALELAFFKLGMEIGMDHLFGTNKIDLSTDMWKAAQGSLDISANIPLLPAISAWEISQGRVPPMNLFGSEGYKKKSDPFDQLAGVPESVERYMRTFGGGLGSAGGAFISAYTHTEEGFAAGIKNGISEAAKTQITRIPFLRDVTDIKPKLAARNKITEEFYSQMQDINKLVDYYKRLDLMRGLVETRPRSKQGGIVTEALEGPPLPPATPGPPQPPPSNPLYIKLMADVYARFKRDNPGYDAKGNELGGVAFLSLLNRHGVATRMLHTLDHVDDGSHTSWQRWMNAPEQANTLKNLKDHSVDPTNKRQVSNYYERVRQQATTDLWFYIRAVMKEMSDKAGKTVTLKDLDPYGKGLKGTFLEAGPTFQFPEMMEQAVPVAP